MNKWEKDNGKKGVIRSGQWSKGREAVGVLSLRDVVFKQGH
jgi:hypothetical protein